MFTVPLGTLEEGPLILELGLLPYGIQASVDSQVYQGFKVKCGTGVVVNACHYNVIMS